MKTRSALHPKRLQAINKVEKSLFRYPDGPSTGLRTALATHLKVSPARVLIGAGSDELIELLGKTFLGPSDSIVVSEHAFLRYRMAADLMGATTIAVPMKNNAHDLLAMARAIRPNTKIIFIANPNNPTGTYNTAKELNAFLKAVAPQANKKKQLVVVDEAYYEYASALAPDYPNTIQLQKKFPFVMVLRTYSKIHALAGLRIGYGIGDPSAMDAMDRVRPPFNVSSLAQAAGIASIQDRAHQAKGVALVRKELPRLIHGIEKLGFPTMPSVANFVLMDVRPRKGKELFQMLLKLGVITRAMDEYDFPFHLRVSVGLPEENSFFLNQLKGVV